MKKFQTSNVSDDNIKRPIGKSIFAEILTLKLFHATVANSDTGSLKSFHSLFDTYLDHMLAKFGPKRMVQNAQIVDLFDENPILLK